MEEIIRELLTGRSLAAPVIAVAVTLLTGLVKRPVKTLAKKMKEGEKLTRFITFLPVVLGFGLTAAFQLISGGFRMDAEFVSLWLTGSSLSLAIYAYKEKFFPSETKTLRPDEIDENLRLIETIRSLDKGDGETAPGEASGGNGKNPLTEENKPSCPQPLTVAETTRLPAEEQPAPARVKIVLKGGAHAPTQKK